MVFPQRFPYLQRDSTLNDFQRWSLQLPGYLCGPSVMFRIVSILNMLLCNPLYVLHAGKRTAGEHKAVLRFPTHRSVNRPYLSSRSVPAIDLSFRRRQICCSFYVESEGASFDKAALTNG